MITQRYHCDSFWHAFNCTNRESDYTWVYPWDHISLCILYLGISLRSDIPRYPPVSYTCVSLRSDIPLYPIPGYIPEIRYPPVSPCILYLGISLRSDIPLYPIPVYPWDQISPCILYLGISLRSDIPLYPPVFYTWVYPWDQISPCIPLYPIPGYIPEIRYPLVSW